MTNLLTQILGDTITGAPQAGLIIHGALDPTCVWCDNPIPDLISFPLGAGNPMHPECSTKFQAEYDQP